MDRGHALIIGASGDLGRAVAVELADLGYELTLWGRDHDRLRRTADAVGDQAAPRRHRVDLTNRDELARAVDAVTTHAGEGRLRAVIWAAGQFDWAPADRADPDAWDQLIDVNLTAAAHTTRLVLPALLAAAPSALVYLGSGAARRSYPNNAAYIASKHGLAGLAGGVFLDVRDRGVKVSLVSPGPVAAGATLTSPMAAHPHRLLQPDDVAAAVRYVLLSSPTACPLEIDLQPQLSP